MLMSVQDAIVFGFENKSWSGNQHGKHTSHILKHFLCLATGKNLVCFLCFYVMLLRSLELCGSCKKKGEKTSAFKQQHKFSLKAAVCGDLCDWALCLPVPRQGKDRQRGPSRHPPPLRPWFPPHPTLQLGTFSISSSGKAGNWLFLWNEHDLERHSAWSACALERVLSCTSHHKVVELVFTKAQLEPEDK